LKLIVVDRTLWAARTYYPATVDKREAEMILVAEGAIIENLVMHVGPRMTERTVRCGFIL
jgi:hypothetical protein